MTCISASIIRKPFFAMTCPPSGRTIAGPLTATPCLERCKPGPRTVVPAKAGTHRSRGYRPSPGRRGTGAAVRLLPEATQAWVAGAGGSLGGFGEFPGSADDPIYKIVVAVMRVR